jgi:hypothetical protein
MKIKGKHKIADIKSNVAVKFSDSETMFFLLNNRLTSLNKMYRPRKRTIIIANDHRKIIVSPCLNN